MKFESSQLKLKKRRYRSKFSSRMRATISVSSLIGLLGDLGLDSCRDRYKTLETSETFIFTDRHYKRIL